MDNMEDNASSSITLSQGIRHDVFLSFRGVDTRNNFTSHLHEALRRRNIETYIDERLETGEEISSALRLAIQASRIAVVIFSEHYASSSWCLDELVHILECRDRIGQVVVPVFYDVDPSHVRKQKESYESAFDELEKRFEGRMDKVKAWRAALTVAANLSGFDSQVARPESRLIKEIVEFIQEKLTRTLSGADDFLGFVGVKERIEEIQSLLCINSSEVLVIGIWGIGGIGKTTLANLVFNKIGSEFDTCYFLANAREELEKHGLVNIRNKLLAHLLEEESLHLGAPVLGFHYVKQRLRRRRVLLVLDDVVDDLCELECLAEKDDWFGPGSRIIITTRAIEVFKFIEVHETYEVKELNHHHAVKLFHENAKVNTDQATDFKDLTEQVASYCKGVPLALKVIGRHLRGKNKRAWKSALEDLAKAPHEKIQNVLKVSYDALTSDEKEVFLDLACFFKGEERNRLEAYFNFSANSLDTLLDKSFIAIQSNKVWMHDLIQQMGQEIVRRQSIKDPGKRSRLWMAKDIISVLETNTGTAEIEAMFVDMSKIIELQLDPKTFSNMHHMRFLKIYDSDYTTTTSKLSLPNDLHSLPNSLIYFHWLGYPSKYLPSNFVARNLVELDMRHSKLERLWDGTQQLGSLKRFDVSHSQLTQIPDLSKAVKLESINLRFCESLLQISPSFQHLKELTYLNLGFCSSLSEFPTLPSTVKNLVLNFTSIKCVPSSIERLSSLERFELSGCQGIKSLPTSICKLKSLWLLNLSFSGLEHFPDILEPMEKLRVLALEGTEIKELPQSIDNLIKLQQMNLNLCTNLERLCDGIRNLQYLEEISLLKCSKLKYIPPLEKSLPFVNARGCTSLDTDKFQHSIQRFVFSDSLLERKMIYYSEIGAKHWSNFDDQTEYGSSFMEHCPGSEIPGWFIFDKDGEESSSIRVMLPPIECRSLKTDGPFYFRFGLCAVVEFKSFDPDKCKVLNFGCHTEFTSKKGGTLCCECFLRGWGEKDSYDQIKNFPINHKHVFLWYDYGMYLDDSEDYMFTEIYFNLYPVDGSKKSVDFCKVIKCGVCIRYYNARDSDFVGETIHYRDKEEG